MAQETLRELARDSVAQALRVVIQEVALDLFRSDPTLRERLRTAILEAFEEISQPRRPAGFTRGRK